MLQTVITFDVDWAPDFVILEVASLLRQFGIKSTWFVTHQSPVLRDLQSDPLFELGIHPNFLHSSTHGATCDEVISHCLKILPDANVCRTHCLAQDAGILDALIQNGIQIDASLLLFGADNLKPVPYYSESGSMIRVPYCWEDCCALHSESIDCVFERSGIGANGIRVLSFHPIHIFLNSASMENYRNALSNSRPLLEQTVDDLRPHINEGYGVKQLFTRLLDSLDSNGTMTHLSDPSIIHQTKIN